MLFLFNLASKAVLFLLPILILPIALSIDYYLMLRFSFIFATYQLILGLIKYILQDKADSVSWLFEVPLMFGYGFVLYNYLPHFVEITYGNLLQWSGPVLLLFEGIQVVRLVMHISYRAVNKMYESPEMENFIKVSIIGGSLAVYLLCGVIVYSVFNHPALTVGLASYLGSLCTFLMMLTVIVIFFVESGVLSDMAFISLFVIFVARSAVLETPMETASGFFESSFQFNYYMNILSKTLNFGTPHINFSQFLTFDFLISTILAVSTVISFPYLDLETEDLTFSSKHAAKEFDSGPRFQENIFGSLLVLFYSHIILTATGNITPAGTGLRIFQSVVTLGFYCWRLYKASESDGFKED